VTASPSTPDNHEDGLNAERDAADVNDGDGEKERNEGAGSNVHPPFYTDIDKLACASNNNNNNNNSYRMFGNKQGTHNSHNSRAFGSHGENSALVLRLQRALIVRLVLRVNWW